MKFLATIAWFTYGLVVAAVVGGMAFPGQVRVREAVAAVVARQDFADY
jgi:hypothetical protein